jgi:stearoyl-CoA desaturase (delta-9 desaturase)
MFRHRAIYSTIGYYLGLICLASSIYLYGASMWLLAAIVLYLAGAHTISVGYHRLFCHKSFKTSRFWHYWFAVYGIFFLYSSPLQWSVTHATHHKYSDTDRDPHPVPGKIDAFIKKGYRPVKLDLFRGRRLLRDTMQYTVDKYYMLIYVLLCITLIVFSYKFFLLSYMPALGIAHLVGAFHNTFSHSNGKARDLWLLEYIIPSAGEWNHGYHHKRPGSWKFSNNIYKLDTGSWLISLIKSKKYPA